MKTPITLTIDADIKEAVDKYCLSNGTKISPMVNNFFKRMLQENKMEAQLK